MYAVGPRSEWATFLVVVLITMVLDRLICSKRPNSEDFRLAVKRTLLWVVVGVGFTGWVVLQRGTETGLNYLTAYLLEESLSVDNLFVFLVIFRHFGVTGEQQRRVLWWGLLGAVLLRALFIVLGTELLSRFHWAFYLFGVFLVLSGLRLLRGTDQAADPSQSRILRLAKRYLRTTEASHQVHQTHFFAWVDGRLHATPLFLVLLVIEISDLVFAIDSVPAVLGITVDLYVVYTSNIMAIVGLRALYFLLSGIMGRFHKLDWALSGVLVFIGVKMIGHQWLQIPHWLSLSVIGSLLCLGVAASLILPPPRDKEPPPPEPDTSGKV